MDNFCRNYRGIAFGVMLALTVTASVWLVLRFIPALLWAIVLTVLMMPIHKRFSKRWSPNGAAMFSTLTAIALIGIPLALVGTVLTLQIASSARQFRDANPQAATSGFSLDSVVAQLDDAIHPMAEKVGAADFHLKEWFAENKEQLVKGASGFAASAAKNTGETLFTLVVAFLTMFFLLRDGHKLREPALELIPLPTERSEEILERMHHTIHAVFVGVVMVAVVQGTIAGVSYWALGVPQPLVWFVATTVLCAIPLLGAPLVYIPMSLLLMSRGDIWQGIVLLVIGFGVVSQIDNLLKPWVIGARTNLHPMAIFFSLLGGVFALGPVGIMAGPVLLTLLLALQDIVRERNRTETCEPAPA